MLSDLVAILREHGLALPPDLALLIKAFITLEGFGRQLDPDFDMAGEAAPLLERVLLAHAAPSALVQRGWRTLSGALGLIAGLPQDLRQLLRSARRGKLQMQVDVIPLKQFGERGIYLHLAQRGKRMSSKIVMPTCPAKAQSRQLGKISLALLPNTINNQNPMRKVLPL